MTKTALLIIDFQNDYYTGGKNPLHNIENAMQNGRKILDAARAIDMPVIHVQHWMPEGGPFFVEGTKGAEIHELFTPKQGEEVITKRQINSFYQTNLKEVLDKKGITDLFIIGAMSHMCIDAVTRAGHDYGYKNTVAHNACATKEMVFNGVKSSAEETHAAYMSALEWAGYGKMVTTEQMVQTIQTSKTALLIIDFQNDYYTGGKNPLHDIEKAMYNGRQILDAARSIGMTVVHVEHLMPKGGPFFVEGTKGAEIHELFTPKKGEEVVTKRQINSFYQTNLKEVLDKKGITDLLIIGAMSHMCIDAVSRAGHDFGYKNTVAHNACATKEMVFNGVKSSAEETHAAYMSALEWAGYAKMVTSQQMIEKILNKKTALLIIDFQNDYYTGGKNALHNIEEAMCKGKQILDAARSIGMPVIHVQHLMPKGGPFFVEGTKGAEIHELFTPKQGEEVVTKRQINSFYQTNLKEVLDKKGITDLFIIGAMSHMCIDAVSRAGYDFGYKNTVCHDACATKEMVFNGVKSSAEETHAAYMSALEWAGYAKMVNEQQMVQSILNQKTALVIVDFQNDYYTGGKNTLSNIEEAMKNGRKILDAARAKGMKVIHVEHLMPKGGPFFVEGTKGAEIHEIFTPQKGEEVVTKRQINSFYQTNLKQILDKNGITNLLIIGAMSHMCIDAVTRAAHDFGYKNTVGHDACATKDLEFNGVKSPANYVHAAYMKALEWAGYGEMLTTEEMVSQI